MSSPYHKIPIQVKPHVKKYLQAIYGDAIIISAENPGSMVMYGFLQKKSQSLFTNKVELHKKFIAQNKTIYLLIQKRDVYRHGISISEKNHVLVNHFFEQQITQLIHLIANGYVNIRKTRKKAIEDFCGQYNIEIDEDITMEALTKNDQRYGEKLKKIALNNEMLKDANFW